jgi:hypothetical protein
MRILVAFLILMAICQPVEARQLVSKDSIVQKLTQIRKELTLIKSVPEATKPYVGQCILTINDALLRLDGVKKSYPWHYITSLERLLTFVRTIRYKDSSAQKEMLAVLDSDLSLKFKSIRNAIGSDLFSDLVQVRVITMQQGGEIKNLRVRYTSLGYKVDYERPDGNFQQLTSPSIEALVPGYYKIWVTVDGDYKMIQEWKGEIDPQKSNVIQMFINK